MALAQSYDGYNETNQPVGIYYKTQQNANCVMQIVVPDLMTSWHENILHINGSLFVESTCHWCFPSQRASNAKLWHFICS